MLLYSFFDIDVIGMLECYCWCSEQEEVMVDSSDCLKETGDRGHCVWFPEVNPLVNR